MRYANGIRAACFIFICLSMLIGPVPVRSKAKADFAACHQNAPRYRVWINSDLNTGFDPDDKVALAQLLLIADHFDIRGMVFLDAAWVRDSMLPAYREEYPNLSSRFDYPDPDSLNIQKASTPFREFSPAEPVEIYRYPTLLNLLYEAEKGPIYLLNWGPMTEVAFLMKYLIDQEAYDIIRNITIISHWTQDPARWNYRGDEDAAAYLHKHAANGRIALYEIGRSGQDMVEEGTGILNRQVVTGSSIGKWMDLKWKGDAPDMSDGATYLVLMGYGGGLDGLLPDGSWDTILTDRLRKDRRQIFRLIEQRATLAATGQYE